MHGHGVVGAMVIAGDGVEIAMAEQILIAMLMAKQ